jgi:hypothetical protein
VLYALMALVLFGAGLLPGRTLSASDYLWSATPWDASPPADVPGLGSNFEQADATQVFQPALQVVRASLPHVPLWDPAMLSGRPLIADPQTAMFSPFSLPAYLLPFWTSLAVTAMLKLLVAAMGGYLLGRTIGMRPAGATLTGLVFGFGLWSVTWVPWTTMGVWPFLPWLCLLCELCLRRPGPLPVAGLATAVGLQFFGGHPSSSVQILAAVAAFFLVRWVGDPSLRERIPARMLALGAGAVAGTALAAAMLVPFGELLLRSADLEARTGASALLHQEPRTLLGIFLHDYWGHGRTAQLFGAQQQERAYYVGALSLMLAAAALILRPRRARVAVAIAGAAALMVATGLPPLYDLVVRLPGLEAANNGRVAVVAVLALAVLAGWGLDDLCAARPAGRRRHLVVGATVVLLAAPALAVAGHLRADALWPALRVAWGSADPLGGIASSVTGGVAELLKVASLMEWLVVAAAAAALVALRLAGRLGAATFAALALAMVAADLLNAGVGHNPVIRTDHARQPTTAAIRFLQRQRPARFVGLRPTAAVALTTPLPPNVAMRYEGLYDARGYVLPTEKRYFRLWKTGIADDPGCYYFVCTLLPSPRPPSLRALGLLGVRHLLQNRGDAPQRGLPLAYAGRDARIYRNPHALPRSFLVDRQRVVAGEDAALAAVTSPRFAARDVAITERRIPGIADLRAAPAGTSPAGTSVVEHDGRERVVVRAEARRPALLVLGDTWYPGWKATVDGVEAPIRRVDYVLRGVRVPSGAHRVEFRYEPLSWRVGWIASLLALAGVALAAVVGLRRARAH